jgi:hypothetical protein
MKMSEFKGFSQVTMLVLVTMLAAASTSAAVAAQNGSMLYQVEFQANEAGTPTSPEQAAELLDQLIVPSLESLSTNGNIRAGGLFVGARSGVFIVTAKSHDEVTILVRALPAWGVWDWKVTPLERYDHRADLEKKVVQQIRAVKQ